MSKPEMAKIDIESPNMADSVMMTMIYPQAKQEFETLNFTSEW